MRILAVAALSIVLLPACPICDYDYDLRVIAGSTPVRVNEQLTLELRNEGWIAGPAQCRGHWYVDGVELGNASVGTITNCGVYSAPAMTVDRSLLIEASEFPPGMCADCCPYGRFEVAVTP